MQDVEQQISRAVDGLMPISNRNERVIRLDDYRRRVVKVRTAYGVHFVTRLQSTTKLAAAA
jgi:hypothetical protein